MNASRNFQRRFPAWPAAAAVVLATIHPALPQGMPPSPVRFTEVREHEVRKSIRLPGSVESPNSSLVATEVEGLVKQLQAREGDVVRKGQVLAKLSTTNLDLQLEAFEAQLKEARARLQLADSNLGRARDLFDSEVVPQQRLDDAFSEFTAWQGRVEALTAQVKKIETDLDRCSIRAPFAGAVVSEETEVGEWLAVGQAVVEMLSLATLEIRVQVPEKYFRNLVPGGEAAVTFESLPDLNVAGKLTAIIPRADPQARTFPVKVTIPNREGRVGAGMLARVALPAGESYRATVVPKDAVVTQGPTSFVYLLNGDNTVSQAAVETGDGAGAWIVVRGPVEPGQQVITRGNERLQEGQTVQGENLEYRSAMRIVQDAIRFPVTTAVGVILVVLFGSLALTRIPIQLTPNVEDPEITVTTFWPGASPQEVEREIVDEQEEQLKSLEGLVKMESSSSDSNGSITLTFQVGTDVDAALLKVSNRLEQVPSYPEDADKPVIRSADPNSNALAWFILEPIDEERFEGEVPKLFDFADDILKPELERVPGVGTSGIFGGEQREMQVIVDPAELAARQVTLNDLGAALERENRNYSGGDFDEGKRRYIVRTVGEYESAEDIENIVIAVRNDVPIYMRDVARAELGFRKPFAKVFQKGRQIIAMNVVKEPGTNALEVMDGVKAAVARLNRDMLAPRGLRMTQVYDQTAYIESAITLVRQSLFIGGFLAILVLLLYLRSGSSTLVIAVAIPISVVGAFMMMYLFGRSLNVISLAGMAFAVGMVVDNSIVVLENIYRHRQMGKSRRDAAHDGAQEVWGAVLASTLTTIAVFVPVVFIKEEAGQLFGDIAIAISCAVALSLIVAITVIPSLSAKILRAADRDQKQNGYHNLWGGADLAGRFTRWVAGTVDWVNGSTLRRLAVIVGLTGASLTLSWLLIPQTEYLPLGNQNFLFGFMLPAPGLSLDEVSELQEVYQSGLAPLWEHPAGSAEAIAQPGGGVRHFFFVALNSFAFMGASANDPLRVRELIPEFFKGNAQIPGAFVVVNQSSIFQSGIGEGRNIDVEITGPELTRLIGLGGEVLGGVMQKLPGSQARPIPSLDLGNPEVQVRTHRRRAAELRISNRDLAFAVSALVDGIKVSDYQYEGKEIDLKVMATGDLAHRTHLLEQLPIATPDGRLVTLGSVADVSVVSGPTQINHSERERTITIQVTPDERTPLEEAMGVIEGDILGPMREGDRLGGLYEAHLSGSADKLTQTGRALRMNFLLALIITYLLMAALFESFLYPFVIMFSVPLAALGGFLGLWAMNTFVAYQALDVLTMLGFIILVGTVVNNAILIVHQSLNHMREEGMDSRAAIRESVATRIRPIFMSVSTSVFGMLPLILFPGAGSELYRGLGSVVVGGLILSTVFTLFLVPALFSLSLDIRTALASRLRRLSWSPREADAG